MPNAGNGAEAVLRQIGSQYPRRVTLDGETLELRLMGDGDVAAVLDFARGMPPEDLFYLVVNFTEESVVRGWVENIKAGQSDYGPRGQRRHGPR